MPRAIARACPGVLDPRLVRLLSRMQRDREDAYYLTGSVFTENDAEDLLDDDATLVIAEVERLLISDDHEAGGTDVGEDSSELDYGTVQSE